MWEQLLALIGDNADAKKIVEQLKGSADQNVNQIQALELQLGDVKSTRDKFKEGNSIVKEMLQLEHVNKETIESALAQLKKTNVDDLTQKELSNLKDVIAKITGEKEELQTKMDTKIKDLILDNGIANLGLTSLAVNPLGAEFIQTRLKENAFVLDDGKSIGFRKADGSTEYHPQSNRPLTLQDKLEDLKTNQDLQIFFKPTVPPGTNTPPNGGSGGNPKQGNFGGSKEDRKNAIQSMIDNK
jgi:hypothetical protein